jgi:hypothetical protein
MLHEREAGPDNVNENGVGCSIPAALKKKK